MNFAVKYGSYAAESENFAVDIKLTKAFCDSVPIARKTFCNFKTVKKPQEQKQSLALTVFLCV